ncbi:MAG: peptide-methionine (S)-S-oxide reductase MsrA [Candidatus Helarchaeota archaeon]
MQVAIFAAGCFWGVQAAFENIPGVIKTTVGYIGGNIKNPTYSLVCSGTTGHAEAVRIEYDPTQISYEQLLTIFFQIHNPTTLDHQGKNIGSQYRSAIFYLTTTQRQKALAIKEYLNGSRRFRNSIVTDITMATEFWPAEEFHQHYYEKVRFLNGNCRSC